MHAIKFAGNRRGRLARIGTMGLLAGSLMLVLLPSAGVRGTAPACATCAAAKLKNQWCDACAVGYVAGVPIQYKMLFEMLDAHGHEVVLSAVECPTCKAAIVSEGFCEKCRIGWVHRLAYFSRLTYHLAKGRACDPAQLGCAVCRHNAEKCGWCEQCKRGMIGNVAIEDRADFDGGCRGYELMLAAIEASHRCKACAIAVISDTRCFFCKIAYKNGKPVASAKA